MHAFTNVPLTLKGLLKQRFRWMRGGVDILLKHGVNKYTLMDFLNHIMYMALLAGVVIVIILTSKDGWKFTFSFHPIAITLATIGYLTSIYRLKFVKNIELTDVLIRLSIVPELLMSITYSVLQIGAYIACLAKTRKTW